MIYFTNFINNIKFLFTRNFNKRIDFIHKKLEKYQVKDIDMIKIYIEENTKRLEYQQEEIKTLQLFLMEHNHIFRKLKDK
tara:strand:- start:333 stop:572 length:240 start_codon:yes stop_codon:yes gene_type:complete